MRQINFNEENELNVSDYWKIMKRRRKFIFALTLLIVFLTLIISLISSKTYESESVIQLATIDGAIYSPAESKNIILSSSVLTSIKEDFFPEKSLKKFIEGNLEIEIITEEIYLKEIQAIPYLHITTKAEKAEKAKQLNEEVIEQFFSYVKPEYEERLNLVVKEMNRLDDDITDLENEINSLDSSQLSGEGISKVTLLRSMLLNYKDRIYELERELINKKEYKIIKQPETPTKYSSPRIKLNLLIALILGFVLSIFLAFFKEATKK